MASGDGFKNLMAVLGWVVAASSLSINYLSYKDKQLERERQELEEPTFSYDVLTYSARSLPSELLQLKQPIRHQFVIRHENGGSVLDLFAEFSSPNADILSVEVATGRQGVVTEVDTGKREASLRKSEVLPGQTIKGYIVTQGVSEVKMNAGARKGRPISGIAPPKLESESVDWFLWIYGAVLVVAAIIGLVLLRRSYSQLVALGILGRGGQISGRPFSLLIALLGLAFLIEAFTNVSFASLFYAFLLFALFSNYNLFIAAAEGLATLARSSLPNQIPPSVNAESPVHEMQNRRTE